MPTPPSDLTALASRLLLLEGGTPADAGATASAAEAVVTKLIEELARVVGTGGATAMAGRALIQARREFPILEELRLDPDAPTRVRGVEHLAGADPQEAEAAAVAVISHLFRLIVTLMGRNLGLRPVRSLWPDAVSYDGATGSNEELE